MGFVGERSTQKAGCQCTDQQQKIHMDSKHLWVKILCRRTEKNSTATTQPWENDVPLRGRVGRTLPGWLWCFHTVRAHGPLLFSWGFSPHAPISPHCSSRLLQCSGLFPGPLLSSFSSHLPSLFPSSTQGASESSPPCRTLPYLPNSCFKRSIIRTAPRCLKACGCTLCIHGVEVSSESRYYLLNSDISVCSGITIVWERQRGKERKWGWDRGVNTCL